MTPTRAFSGSRPGRLRAAAPVALAALASAAACDLSSGPPDPMVFRVPIEGTARTDWFYGTLPNHDNDPEGAEDYMCGTKTLEFRQTTDFLIPSFRDMDRGVDVLAAADGEVVRVVDGHPDRNLSYQYSRTDNEIRVLHDDGVTTRYRFLKRGSMTVGTGDRVEAGQVIAQVGSSGNSSWPRLGFEVQNRDGDAFDPWAGACSGSASYWTDQPDYPIGFTVVDHGTTDLPATLTVVAGRPPDVTTFRQGQNLTFWVHTVNRPIGQLSMRVLGPATTLDSAAYTYGMPDPENTVYGGLLTLSDSARTGAWAIEYAMNDETFARLEFDVVSAPAASRATGSRAGGTATKTELRVAERLRLDELTATR